MNKTLVVPDCHHPSVDRKAWELLLKVGKSIKPDTVIVMGDFGDFASVTSHAKNHKQRSILLADELFACNEALCDLEEIGAKEKIFVLGNHEDRLSRYIAERCPEMHGLYGTTVQSALRLDDRGFKTCAYREHLNVNGLYVTHDTGTAGVNAHRSSLLRFQRDIIIGHTHRLGYEAKRTIHGDPIIGAMFGWLGDAKLCAGYMHDANATVDWCHGFGVVYTDKSTNHIQPVVIQANYTCVVEGKLYK